MGGTVLREAISLPNLAKKGIITLTTDYLMLAFAFFGCKTPCNSPSLSTQCSLDKISNNGNDYDNDSYKKDKYDDEYYLDQNRDPPRFYLYREARAEKWQACRPHGMSDHDKTITQDEL